ARPGPRRAPEQQVIKRRPRYSGEIGLESHPIHDHTASLHLHFEGFSSDGDGVFHRGAPTPNAEVGTRNAEQRRKVARRACVSLVFRLPSSPLSVSSFTPPPTLPPSPHAPSART